MIVRFRAKIDMRLKCYKVQSNECGRGDWIAILERHREKYREGE